MDNKTGIVCDVDGVVLNWYDHALRELNVEIKPVKDWNCPIIKNEWDNIVDNVNYWGNINEYNPYDGLNFDCYLSSFPEKFHSTRLLNLHKTSWPIKPLFISHDKANWMLKHDYHTIIDDKPETIKDCLNKGLRAIQFYPYYADWEIIKGAEVIRDIRELTFLNLK